MQGDKMVELRVIPPSDCLPIRVREMVRILACGGGRELIDDIISESSLCENRQYCSLGHACSHIHSSFNQI
ncbi:protein of unknown function [Magnetospirillum sp. XM-1]|nr:protein of unknown function [Magnetospirillum sp. XM-1]